MRVRRKKYKHTGVLLKHPGICDECQHYFSERFKFKKKMFCSECLNRDEDKLELNPYRSYDSDDRFKDHS
jgi:hypothetical protein